ncbi:menaquinone biosynthesis decarboxylase [Paenibacillus sp. J31TS4]|uniref:UbiD family decarboxylase n=1 Tax=Paenibacillus sp. J31TS4 TaxID=2807195 RepID=UPI001B063C8C|nr:UbiD family decarboxylase [Paenibacillus sp. J31TS4]GIP40734.1 menaquinone biosynthesis decarboxylase [Paenibacillus sp. J31TS4]
MFDNLRQYLDCLRRENDLVEISAPVDPNLELAEIHRRVIEENGPALLFTNVKGSAFPVATNLFGTSRRVDLAFGPKPEQLMKQVVGSLNTLLPPTFKGLWGQKDMLFDLLKVGMKSVSSEQAPILKHCDRDNPMTKLPVLTSWQEDGGPFVTLPLVYTEKPGGGDHNLGMYRMQVYDGHTTGMHWQIHKGGGFHHYEAEQRNEALPVTVFLGGPPALIASAIAPVPEHLPELLLTSLILGKKLGMTANPNGGHRLVAEAEFAISGKVPPHVRRLEGPFGDHFGYYSLAHDFPVFEVDHVWRRDNAIYPATIVGKPRQEDYYLGEFLQRLLSPAFPIAMPGVKSLWTYAESGFHSLAAAVVRESYSREALGTAFRILGEGQLTLTKFLLLTDQMTDLADFRTLLGIILERFQPERDLFIFNHTSHDTLDYTGHALNKGSKAVLMGLGEPVRELPAAYTAGQLDGIAKAAVFIPGCLVVSGASYTEDPELAPRIVDKHADQLENWPLVILADDTDIAASESLFLWTVFTRFSPAMDLYARSDMRRHHIGYKLPIVIDARMKPGYPDELIPLDSVVQQVDSRWKDYFPNGL